MKPDSTSSRYWGCGYSKEVVRDGLSGGVPRGGRLEGPDEGGLRSLDSIFQAMGSRCKILIMKRDDLICFHSF